MRMSNYRLFYLKYFLNFKNSNAPIAAPSTIPSKKVPKRNLISCDNDINIFASIKTPSNEN